MLGSYEKTIHNPHPWSQPQPQPQPQPQNNLIRAADDQTAMAQPNQSNQNQKQEALRCPRCDSSNTKFCYYNNYSLSQPRYFCKACKRYWTRGGTLRNVPVGGGCRKNNKRVRKPAASSTNSSNMISSSPLSSSSSCSSLSNNGSVQNNHANHYLGLLYGMPVTPNPNPPYDLQNSRTQMTNGVGSIHGHHHHLASSKQIFQDLISSSNYPLLLSGYTSASSPSLNMKGSANNFGTILPSYGGMFDKEMKVELEGQNRQMDHNNMGMMEMGMGLGSSLSDPSLLWGGGGGTNSFTAWLDPSSSLSLLG